MAKIAVISVFPRFKLHSEAGFNQILLNYKPIYGEHLTILRHLKKN